MLESLQHTLHGVPLRSGKLLLREKLKKEELRKEELRKEELREELRKEELREELRKEAKQKINRWVDFMEKML